MRNRFPILITAVFLAFGLSIPAFGLSTQHTHAQTREGDNAGSQRAELLAEEADAVYLTNLERRAAGAPPLRWNAELTDAARWFSWDSVENRDEGFCGHQDTAGNWPDARARNAGYPGAAGAENAFCGYLSGADAVEGWMNSTGHRDNMLDPNHREVGLGYYQDPASGRGYVTQDFGRDGSYAPVVLDNEALTTASGNVEVYVYDSDHGAGLHGRGPVVAMQVSNDACFSGAAWEPYVAAQQWSLAAGDAGWRTVYVKTRDRFNRSAVAQDSIYMGSEITDDALADVPLSTAQHEVTLYDLDTDALPSMQFSLGWLADDTHESFHKWWGAGDRVDDAAAWGGSSFRMAPGDGETFAWIVDTTFVKDTPFVAYFRLKVSDNTAPGEVARVSVKGGGVEYGPLVLKGADFVAADTYQEFPVAFTFNTNPDDVFLLFQVWRSGDADVSFDAVTVFTAPQPVASPYTWQPPGGHYRGQGVWVRYSDGAGAFTDFVEAATTQRALALSTGSLSLAAIAGMVGAPVRVDVTPPCGSGTWDVSTDAAWLAIEETEGAFTVRVDASALAAGEYATELIVTAEATSLRLPVSVRVEEAAARLYLPLLQE